LVSFEDYPLARGGATAGDSSLGGSAPGGSSSGGDAQGGSASGGEDVGGTSAGGTPSGGSGGSGGGDIGPDQLLIDDFEDGDSQLLPNAGRNGAWFTSNDGSSQQNPNPNGDCLPLLLSPPRPGSTRALHTTGANFTTWGALIGANFSVNGAAVQAYDISAHTGITFSARLGKSTAAKMMRVQISDANTMNVPGCTGCGDHFGTTVYLGDMFQTFRVPFAMFKQQGWGKQFPAFDATKAFTLSFLWGPRQTFDAWIDDVAFY
jgi:hypothetical protein